jgi:hypothetical protein
MEYVTAAIAVMKVAETEADLIEWWKGEKPNRDRMNLNPETWPGLDLLSAFRACRIKLEQRKSENENVRRVSEQAS